MHQLFIIVTNGCNFQDTGMNVAQRKKEVERYGEREKLSSVGKLLNLRIY